MEGTDASANRSRLNSRVDVAHDVISLMGILFEQDSETGKVVEGNKLAAKSDMGNLSTLGVRMILDLSSLRLCSLSFLSFC